MSRLGRRLDVLEALADEVRLRPYRRFAADHGMTVEEVLDAIAEERWLVNRLDAQGLTVEQIMARCSETWGIPLDELRAGCERIGERYFTEHA